VYIMESDLVKPGCVTIFMIGFRPDQVVVVRSCRVHTYGDDSSIIHHSFEHHTTQFWWDTFLRLLARVAILLARAKILDGKNSFVEYPTRHDSGKFLGRAVVRAYKIIGDAFAN